MTEEQETERERETREAWEALGVTSDHFLAHDGYTYFREPDQPGDPQPMGEEGFTFHVFTRSGYDARAGGEKPEPHVDFGRSGVDLTFAVVGPKGAVDWRLLTDWMPRGPALEDRRNIGLGPTPGPVGQHRYATDVSDEEKADDWTPEAADCLLLGESCISENVSFTLGEEVYDELVKDGFSGVHRWLREMYRQQFGA